MSTRMWALIALGICATYSSEAMAQFGSDIRPVGAPIGRAVGGQPFRTSMGSFGSPATPVFQPVNFDNVVAPVREIPTAENESFFDSFYRKLMSIIPFTPEPTSPPKTGWFPSLRRRNVERHQMWNQ